MLNSIKKVLQSKSKRYDYTILIPSWNNLAYLKLCLQSIRENSALHPQVVVFVNEGSDSTVRWLEEEAWVDYVHAPENLGICYSMNLCRLLVKSEYIVYLNDDMYVLPGWDKNLMERAKSLNTKMFMLSATMIEPLDTGNACVLVKDAGRDLESFNRDKLLEELDGLTKPDWYGATWPPNMVHIDAWDLVGGLSVEFSPGMYSDPDFSKKLYDAGVRIFLGVGNSFVYHFGCKSTGRVKKNKGHRRFLLKWELSSGTFARNFLHLGKNAQSIHLPDPRPVSVLKNKLKILASVLKSEK